MKVYGHWLNQERISFYPRIFFFLYLLMICSLWFFMIKNMVDINGQPFGHDFIVFWTASHLALTGHAQDAYSIPLLFKAQQIAVPSSHAGNIWFYPPAFFIIVLPLALLPYFAAYWTFMLLTLGAFVLVLRRIVKGNTAMWCIAGFSGLWINLFFGQNAFLTATLAGSALLFVERRPLLAGMFIGLLAAVKPHLALLFPVALISIGAWHSLFTAALTTIASTAIGTLILGTGVLRGFLANLSYARQFLENGLETNPWTLMPTSFAFALLHRIPVVWAYAVHFVIALAAMIIVWHVWRRCHNMNLRAASLMIATFLVNPYFFSYDLAWLAFPIAWLSLDGLQNGWLRGEREILLLAWLLPILIVVQIFTPLILPIGPLVLFSLLWITVRRSDADSMRYATKTSGHTDQFETVR